MNYYIQGDAAKSEQIKAALKAKGISDGGNSFIHNNYLYFTEGGETDFCHINGHVANIIKTHPDYKRLVLPIEFKDGDIIGFNDCTNNSGSYVDWVGIYEQRASGSRQHLFHCVISSERRFRIGGSWRIFTAYTATQEQRDLLFAKMKEAGYEWDADKKELRKIQPHYDIANFKPKQWVLVRDDDEWEWALTRFSHLSNGSASLFVCINGASFQQCIPFDGNENLLGTSDMPSEEYINWQ